MSNMILVPLTGLFTLAAIVSGNFFGSPWSPMPSFPAFPAFPAFPSPFQSNPFSSSVFSNPFNGASRPTQGITIGEQNPSAPSNNNGGSSSSGSGQNGFPFGDFASTFSNFNNFIPSSAGISTAAASSSNANYVTSSSTKSMPDGSTVTETVTYDSRNPSKPVTRVIKTVDANGKVTTKTA